MEEAESEIVKPARFGGATTAAAASQLSRVEETGTTSSADQTAASSTTLSRGESLGRFDNARPGGALPGKSASERSLTIDNIAFEEPVKDVDTRVDHSHDNDDDDDDDDTSNRTKGHKPIMKYKTLEESLEKTYESGRRKYLSKRHLQQKKAPKKKKRRSGTALARMGRRVSMNVCISSLRPSRGGRRATGDPLKSEPPIQNTRPTCRRRASLGDLSELRTNAIKDDLPNSKTSKKRTISSKSLSKAFNDSIGSLFSFSGSHASLLSTGSKSQGDGIKNDDDDNEDEDEDNTVLRFSTVEIREYDTQVDTNPSVSSGPALGLSWSYSASVRATIETYEKHRPPRRQMKEMRMPASEREFRLRMSGVSREEIEASIKSIREAREKRRKAIRQMKNDTMLERMEGIKRKLLKMFGRKKSQRQEEKELWEHAQAYFAVDVSS